MAYDRYPQHLLLAAGAALDALDPHEVFIRTGQLIEMTIRHLGVVALAHLVRDFRSAHHDLDLRPTLDNWTNILEQTLALYRLPKWRTRFVCPELLDEMEAKLTNRVVRRAVGWLRGQFDEPIPPNPQATVAEALSLMARFRVRFGAQVPIHWPRVVMREANHVLLPAIMALFDQLVSLDHHPVVLVESVEPAEQDTVVCHLRLLQGDSPRRVVATLTGPTAALVPGHLYLAGQQEGRVEPSLALYPWLVFFRDPLSPEQGEVQFLTQSLDRWQYAGASSVRELDLVNRWPLSLLIPESPAALEPPTDEGPFQADRLRAEDFSPEAWAVLKAAAVEAGRGGWYQVHPAHVVVSLGCRPGPLAEALGRQGLPEHLFVTLARHLIGGRQPLSPVRPPLLKSRLAPDLVEIIRRAFDLAIAGGIASPCIELAHLQRALVEARQSSAGRLLELLGIDPDELASRWYGRAAAALAVDLGAMAAEPGRPLAEDHDRPVGDSLLFAETGRLDSRYLSPRLVEILQHALAYAEAAGEPGVRSEVLFRAMALAGHGPTAEALIEFLPAEQRGRPAAEALAWVCQWLADDLTGSRPEPWPGRYPLRLHRDSFTLGVQLVLARAERLLRPGQGEVTDEPHVLLAMLADGDEIRHRLAQLGFDVSAMAQWVARKWNLDYNVVRGRLASTAVPRREPIGGPTGAQEAVKIVELLFQANGKVNPAMFTAGALASLAGAQKAARDTRGDAVRTPHLFMGLLVQAGGLAERALKSLGQKADLVHKAFGRGFLQQPGVEAPVDVHREFFSDNVIRLLQEARTLCLDESRQQISEKDLLTVLLRDGDGVVVYTLRQLGIDPQALLEACHRQEQED